MVIYGLAWPDPSLHRVTITCSISTYTASDNALHELGSGYARPARLFMPSLHYHMDTLIPLLLFYYQYVCPTIHHVSTNSAFADNASREYRFKYLKTILTLKSDNAHY